MTTVLDQITGLLSSFPIFSFMAEHNKHDCASKKTWKKDERRWRMRKVKSPLKCYKSTITLLFRILKIEGPFLTDKLLNPLYWFKNHLFLNQPQNILTYFEEKEKGIISIPSRGFRSFSSALYLIFIVFLNKHLKKTY